MLGRCNGRAFFHLLFPFIRRDIPIYVEFAESWVFYLSCPRDARPPDFAQSFQQIRGCSSLSDAYTIIQRLCRILRWNVNFFVENVEEGEGDDSLHLLVGETQSASEEFASALMECIRFVCMWAEKHFRLYLVSLSIGLPAIFLLFQPRSLPLYLYFFYFSCTFSSFGGLLF